MSYKETDRLKVISRIAHKGLTVAEAAEILHVSERQMYRILDRYAREGEAGLIHKLRGIKSSVSTPEVTRRRIVALYRERYSDYGPTFFAEKLEEHHNISVSRQTVMRVLKSAHLWSGTRKKRPHRKKRERRGAIGSMVQFDGSTHAWFEDRGPVCCLLVAIDDASSRVFLRFAPSENTRDVLLFWHQYCERYGIPSEIYTDFGSVYHDNNGNQKHTQYGRAMTALNVRLIYAHSPQAKGRVERANRTFQERLLRELREHKISSIHEANRFLDTHYLAKHNKRFAKPDGLQDVHRSSNGIDLKNIFCFEEMRKVYNDYTITLGAQFIQLLKSNVPLPPPRSRVMVHQWLDESLHIFWNQNELRCKPLEKKSSPKSQFHNPAENHPWRTKRVSSFRNMKKKIVRSLA